MKRTLATLALAVAILLAAAGARADTPYRGWKGELTLAPGERLEVQTLPNGRQFLVRLPATGTPVVVLEVFPAEVHLARPAKFPEEKLWLQHLTRGEQEQAATLLAKILDSPGSGHDIVRPPWETACWVSVRTLARSRLLALEPAGRAAVRRLEDDEAIPRFELASRNGNAHELEELVDRYPVATPAAAAAVQAGDLFLEAGELRSAIRAWTRARQDYPDEVDAAAVEPRIERAELLSRTVHRAPLRMPRAHPSAAGALGGKSLPGEPHLRLLWRRPVRLAAPGSASPIPALLAHPHEEAVFVQDEAGCFAVELETGRLMWRTPLEREQPLAADTSPAAVAVGDAVVAVRGRRIAWVLERATGRVTGRIHVVRDLGGGPADRIDAVASERGEVFVAATVNGDRVLAAFDRMGTRLWKVELWNSTFCLDASLLLGPEGIFLLADSGVASLDRTGSVRWLRGALALYPGPGRTTDRVLARAGASLAILSPEGTTLLDPESGERAGLPAVPRSVLVVGCGDDGPVFLDAKPPAGNPPLLLPAGRVVRIPRRLEADALPLWTGVVARGSLVLSSVEGLVAVDLTDGTETRCRAPAGRLSVSGDTIVVSCEDEVLAFAPRAAAPRARPLPDDVRGVCARLSSVDWRERAAARDKLRALGAEAEPALKDILDTPGANPEARDVARALLKGIGMRTLWDRAFADLHATGTALRSPELVEDAPALVQRLVSVRPGNRLAALRTMEAHESAAKGEIKAPPSFLRVLRVVAKEDEELSVRVEALALLARHDAGVRASVRSVLLGDVKNEAGRETAASVLVASGAASPSCRGNAILAEALASDREDIRSVVYRALLRHGGPRERAIVTDRVGEAGSIRGRKGTDPVAETELRAWVPTNVPPDELTNPDLRTDELPPGRVDDDRRALLDRVPLGE